MTIEKKLHRVIYCLIALTVLSLGNNARADDDAPPPRILVSGEGSVAVPPDMAVLTLTVNREAASAGAALDANSSAMRDVLRAMQDQGVAKPDLQTSGFSIQPQYFYPKPSVSGDRNPRQIVGYSVRNSLTVRVRDISKLGAILDKSITLGVNEGGNIGFTNDDPSTAISQARTQAVHNAVARANTLAEAAGVKLGKILEISERSKTQRPIPVARAAMAMAESSSAVPLASGENTYRVNVNVSFAIDQ